MIFIGVTFWGFLCNCRFQPHKVGCSWDLKKGHTMQQWLLNQLILHIMAMNIVNFSSLIVTYLRDNEIFMFEWVPMALIR